MQIIFTKGDAKYSSLKCIRDDMTFSASKMPEQGIIPHDMIHYVIEKHFALSGAFYGSSKAGANIDFKLQHNQLSQDIADNSENWQAESLVGAMQAILWSGNLNYNNFIYLVNQACETRHIIAPSMCTGDFFDCFT